MKKFRDDEQLIRQFATPLSGVFLFSDLMQLLAEPYKTAAYRRIAALEKSGLLVRFIKGVYISEGADPEVLNQKICSGSYVSFGRVLAEHGIIQGHAAGRLDAVKVGRTRIHSNENLCIRQLGIASHLMFGFEFSRGLKRATPEKALLDTFYFHMHGLRFPFDTDRDIHWRRVDPEILSVYLQEYRNPKFVSFIQRQMHQAFRV